MLYLIFPTSSSFQPAICKNVYHHLFDVLLTNQPLFCFNSVNFERGSSEWHTMVYVAFSGAATKVEEQRTKYRSFKNFDQDFFNDYVGQISLHSAYVVICFRRCR